MNQRPLLAALLCGLAACGDIPSTITPAATPIDVPTGPSFARDPIPGEYIVRFRDSEQDVDGRIRSTSELQGAPVLYTYRSAIKGLAVKLTPGQLAELQLNPAVIAIQQNQTISLTTTQSPATWGIDRVDQQNLPLSNSYTYSGDGTGVTVYIIDTGINYTHSEYNGRAFFGTDKITPSTSGADCNGHGSHVSGTVGGTTYGLAKNVRLIAVRVLSCGGSGSSAGVIAGVDWVTLNRTLPAVANMSLGGPADAALDAAVANSIVSGVTYAIAAGNNNLNECATASPARVATAITVGATTITDSRASFSNFGACLDIFAPGQSITSAWLGTGTNTISGTSMATPHVAGAAALYLQANPSATPAQVATALTTNATNGVITGLPVGTINKLLYTGFMNGPQPPVASFTFTCSGLSCNFDASSSVALASATYSWTFGDAATGTGKTPSHTYGANGTYSVSLTVADANGSNTTTKNVVVSTNQAPVARFTINCPTQQCFADASTSTDDVGIVSYAWNWGNGKAKTVTTPTTSTTFPNPGTFTVTLIVTDGGGLTGTTSQQVTVPTPTGNRPPTANITAPSNGAGFTQGANVQFTGSGADPEDGPLSGASLVWSSSRDGQIGTGGSFSKSDLTVGSHTITLTSKDAQGLTGTASVNITITASNQPPTANISAPTNGAGFTQGASVQFTGSGADPEDGPLTGASLVWSSSRDGQIGTGGSFSKSNLTVGSHTITLTSKDAQGLTGTATVTITINPPNQSPTASITSPANNSSFVQGVNVSFNGSGNDPEDGALTGASLVWTSDLDGQIGTGGSFNKSNLSVGTHTITLTAKDAQGLTGTASITVTITPASTNQPPVANFTFNCTGLAVPHQCAFNASSSTDDVGIVSYKWDWGNGRSETWVGTQGKNTWASAGTFNVTLTVKDGAGLTNSITKAVPVP